jgi:hypothetical protein
MSVGGVTFAAGARWIAFGDCCCVVGGSVGADVTGAGTAGATEGIVAAGGFAAGVVVDVMSDCDGVLGGTGTSFPV